MQFIKDDPLIKETFGSKLKLAFIWVTILVCFFVCLTANMAITKSVATTKEAQTIRALDEARISARVYYNADEPVALEIVSNNKAAYNKAATDYAQYISGPVNKFLLNLSGYKPVMFEDLPMEGSWYGI